MKKQLLVITLAIITILFFLNLISASLIENSTWQSNLTGSAFSNGAVLGDIDNDGDLDLVSIGCSSGSIFCSSSDKSRVYINNGTTFQENTTWEQNLSNVTVGSISLGDIDNDGDLDLVLSLVEGGGTKIYANNGTTFTENSTWQNSLLGNDGADSPSVALGDIDNDGDLDLVFPGMESNRVIYLNNGTSFLNNSIWGQEITDVGKETIGLIDLDNDLDLDINIMGLASAKGYINNGTSFEADANWNTLTADEGSIIWGDIDNDGDFDAVLSRIAGSCAGGDVIFINNGTALLTNSSWDYDMFGFQFGSLAFGDYDNNGYLDLANFGICGGTDSVQILSNNGTIFAQDVTAQSNITGQRSSSSLWGDIDNDGDLDLVVIKSQKVHISNASLTNPNEAPTPPIGFSYSYNNRKIKLGWNNGSDNETTSTGLYYNLKLGTSSNNHSIISGIYGGQGDASNGGGTAFGYFGNMMQRKNFTLKVDRLSPSTTYYWSVQTIDTALKAGNWSVVQSFVTPLDMTSPNITLNAPVDNSNLSSYNVVFNATVSDNLNLSNVSLYGNWTGSFTLNQTNTSGINNTDYIFTVNLTGYPDGSYKWMIQANDNATNVENSSIRTFTLDTTNPSISITTPANNTNSTNNGLDVNYTVSDLTLSSCWYSNDSMTVNSSITCGQNITNITWSEGQHNVTIWANDSFGNINSSSISFSIDSINPSITITTPSNNTNSTNTGLDVNYTVSDTNLQACWYSNDSMTVNVSLICGQNITNITWSEGQHNVTVYTNDSAGNENSSSATFTVDSEYPLINLISPANASTWTSSSTVTFSYNVTDVDIANCSLIINSAIDQTDTSISEDTSQSFTKSLSNADYIWSINCTDYVGFTNKSASYSLTVSVSSGGGGSGGSGGTTTTSFWTSTYVASDEDFKQEQGYAKELSKKQRVKVSVNNEAHYVGIVNLTETTATINVSSTPQQAILSIGEEKKFEVTDDNFYDILVRLNSIVNQKANLTIQQISEEIAITTIDGETPKETVSEEEMIDKDEKEKDTKKNLIWIRISLITIIVLFLGYVLTKYFTKKYQNRFNNKVKVLKEKMDPGKILLVKTKSRKRGERK